MRDKNTKASVRSGDWHGVAKFYRERQIGRRIGFGDKAAVLIIDMQVAYNDPSYKVGADQTEAVEAIKKLLDCVRRLEGIPIIFTADGFREDGKDGGMFIQKIPAMRELTVGSPGAEIDPRLAPLSEEHVITKKYPSGFFETHLLSLLVTEKIDTVILTGCSTSGCVRATAVDAVSYGYHVIVPEECVADRAWLPHTASLFDIDAKYGDVITLGEVISHLERHSLRKNETSKRA